MKSQSVRLMLIALAMSLAACGSRESSAPQEGSSGSPAASDAATAKVDTVPHRIYVTNEMSGDMTVIDGQTREVIATVPLGKRPRGIQVSPDGKQLFIALSGTPIAPPGVDESTLPPPDREADGIGVVDIATHQIVRVIRGFTDPEQLVLSPDGQRMYIASEDSGTAVIVDVASGKVIKTLEVGEEPEGVGISPDGKFVYVTAEEDNLVSVIDTEKQEVVKQFKVGNRPRSATFTADGSRAYVTGEMDGTVSVVDAKAHTVLKTIKLEGETVRPMEVDLSKDGSLAYVSTGRGQMVYVIDTSTNEPVGTAKVGQRAWGMDLSPDGKFLYTANGPSNDVSVVDLETLETVATIPAGRSPWGVAVVAMGSESGAEQTTTQ